MINFIFFMTTKGHCGRKDLYKFSLKNIDSLSCEKLFDRYLSIKVFKNDQEETEKILKDFKGYKVFPWYNPDPNINDESPYKDYAYYLLTNYLIDIVNLYSQEELLKNKYTFIYEDDSPIIINQNNFNFYINKSIEKLEQDKDIFSVHFKRIGVFKEDEAYLKNTNSDLINLAEDYNFQNQLFRTEDMFKTAQAIKNNWEKLKHIHTETAVKLGTKIINPNFKYLEFNPKYAHSIHIGTFDSEKWIESYSL